MLPNVFPFNIFLAAQAKANLSPAARAFLKFFEGAIYSVAVAYGPSVLATLNQQSPNYGQALQRLLLCLVLSVLMAASKFFKAFGDPAIGAIVSSATDQAATTIQQQFPPAGVTPPAPAPASAPAAPATVPAAS